MDIRTYNKALRAGIRGYYISLDIALQKAQALDPVSYDIVKEIAQKVKDDLCHDLNMYDANFAEPF